jgi:lipopolysaccharide transport system permease protein
MIASAKQIFQAKDLLRALTDRNIRARYQQSIIGGLWIIVQPLTTAIIFSIIFTYFVPVDTGDIPYPVFSYTAVVPWLFLSSSLTDMTASLVANMNLVTKIYFPREMLPISSMLARLVDFLVGMSLLVIMIFLFDVPVFPAGWLFLPVILLVQIILITGLGFMFSAVNVFYRDAASALTLGIQLWFYASPIIYPVSMVPERLRPIYQLNPMAGILESYRAVFLYQSYPPPSLIISAIVSVILFVLGYWFFKRKEFEFADIV